MLNDSVSTPSSSRDVTGWRRVKSPCATARVPSASKPSGCENRSDSTTASPSADVKREQQRQRQRQLIEALQRGARERDLLVIARARLHFLEILRERARHALDHLQHAQRIQPVAAVDRHDDAQHQPGVLRLLDLRVRLLQPRAAQRVAGQRLRRHARRPTPATASTLPDGEYSAAS